MAQDSSFYFELYALMLWLGQNRRIGFDPKTHEYSPTRIAEYVADEYDHPEWLSYPQHIIWEAAEQAAHWLENH